MTQAKHELDLVPNEEPFSNEEITDILSQTSLMRLGGLRAFYFADTIEQGICYINGVEINFDKTLVPVIQLLCDNVCVEPEALAQWRSNSAFIIFIKAQLDLGYWYFAQ